MAAENDSTIENQLATSPSQVSPSVFSLNTAQKIILTLGTGIIPLLLAAAFLAQSPRFPETEFELFLYIAGITAFYILLLVSSGNKFETNKALLENALSV